MQQNWFSEEKPAVFSDLELTGKSKQKNCILFGRKNRQMKFLQRLLLWILQ